MHVAHADVKESIFAKASAQRKLRHGVGAKEIVIPAKAGIHFDFGRRQLGFPLARE
jgi:hypothetical protein